MGHWEFGFAKVLVFSFTSKYLSNFFSFCRASWGGVTLNCVAKVISIFELCKCLCDFFIGIFAKFCE